MSFSQIIETVLNKLKNDTTISLNEFEIAFIKRVIAKEPTIFNNISFDEKITLADIPKIILIISNLYSQHFINTDVNINIINLIEFTVNILIELSPIPQCEIILFTNIITFSLELLKKNLPFIEETQKKCSTGCYTAFKQFFVNLYTKMSSCKCNCKC